MKNLLVLIIILLTFQVKADDAFTWGNTEKGLFCSYVLLNIIDIGQTNRAMKLGFVEVNPFVGKYPTPTKLTLTKIAGIGLIYLVLDNISNSNRKWLLYPINGLMLGVVTYMGLQPGIGFNLRF